MEEWDVLRYEAEAKQQASDALTKDQAEASCIRHLKATSGSSCDQSDPSKFQLLKMQFLLFLLFNAWQYHVVHWLQELKQCKVAIDQMKCMSREQTDLVSSHEQARFESLSWRGSFNQPNGSCKKFVQDEVRRFVWLNGRSCRGAKMWSSNWSLTHLTSQQWCSANSRTQTWLTLKIYFQIWTHATYD